MFNKFYKFIVLIIFIKIICLSSPARIHSTNPKQFLRETWESIKNSVTSTNNIIEIVPDMQSDSNTNNNNNNYQKLIIETFYDLSESIHDITLAILKNLSEFATSTKKILTNGSVKIKSTISVLGGKILENQNDTIKVLMEIIKQQLQQIEKLFGEVALLTEHEFQRITTHINETLLIFSHDMESWSTDLKIKLRSIKNDQNYEDSCKLIDQLINESFRDMYECCNIAIRPSQSICKSVKDIFGNTLKIVIDTVEQIDDCMVKAKGSTNEFMLCINDAISQVNQLWTEAIGLKERLKLGNDFPIKVIYSNGCIGVASYSIQVRKSEMEKQLDRKYKINNNNNKKL